MILIKIINLISPIILIIMDLTGSVNPEKPSECFLEEVGL